MLDRNVPLTVNNLLASLKTKTLRRCRLEGIIINDASGRALLSSLAVTIKQQRDVVKGPGKQSAYKATEPPVCHLPRGKSLGSTRQHWTDEPIYPPPIYPLDQHRKLCARQAGFATSGYGPEIAIKEIDRAMLAGIRFDCALANAGHGLPAPFRQALSSRSLTGLRAPSGTKKFTLQMCR